MRDWSYCLLLAAACSTAPERGVTPVEVRADRATEEDGSCEPQILSETTLPGDMPLFLERLKRAYCSADDLVCARLPTPQPQLFDGESVTRAPSREEWVAYCYALAAADPQLCRNIDGPSSPNLRSSCESFFQLRAQPNNDSPAFCLAQLGVIYNSADEVRNCLSAWGIPIFGHVTAAQCMQASAQPPFTQFDLDVWCCLRLPKKSALTEGQPDQQQCLFALAQSTKNDRVCLLIDDPYPSNPGSPQNCLAALSQ